jgi:hypothetical protein
MKGNIFVSANADWAHDHKNSILVVQSDDQNRKRCARLNIELLSHSRGIGRA